MRLHRCRTPVPTLKKQRRRDNYGDCVGIDKAHREKPLLSADVADYSAGTAAVALTFVLVPLVLMGLGLTAGWALGFGLVAAYFVHRHYDKKHPYN